MRLHTRFITIAALVGATAAAAFALPAAASAEPLAVLTGSAAHPSLTLLDSAHPGQTSVLPITGVGAGETPSAIDVRPSTGGLYLVTIEDTPGTDTGRLYSVNLGTGAATLIGSPFSTALTDGTTLSADFDPNSDTLRVISADGDNLRVNPTTGAAVTATYVATNGEVDSIAYDRNVAGTTTTTLFGLDATGDQLVRVGGVDGLPSADGGVVSPIGALGFNATAPVGFDISTLNNTAYLLNSNGADPADLRTVNLTTGAATSVSAPVLSNPTDIAVLAPSTIGFTAATANAEERTGRIDVMVTRLGSTQVAGSVDYATADGTAKAGSDYIAQAGTVKFAPGEMTKTISIPVIDDGTGDAGETFTLNLTNPTGAGLGTATQTITTVETQVTDKTPPAIVVSDLGIKAYKFYIVNGMHTTYSCQEACKVVYTVRLGTSYISKVTGELHTGGVGIVAAQNSLLGKARLQKLMAASKSGKLVARFAIQATDANGLKRTLVRNFQIVR